MPVTATNPKTGEKVQLNETTGQWEPFGQNPNAGVAPGTNNMFSGDALKNLLTVAGSTIAPALLTEGASIPLSMGVAALGGAAGRMAGHGAQALTNPDQASLGADALEGLLAGAGGEVLPIGVNAAGKGLRIVGETTGKASPWLRGFAGREIAGAPGAIAATVGPPVAKRLGAAMERVPSKTTSQILREATGRVSEEPGDLAAIGKPERYAPNRSRVSREVPGFSYKEPSAPAVEVPPQVEPSTGVERYAPNTSMEGLRQAATVPSPPLTEADEFAANAAPNYHSYSNVAPAAELPTGGLAPSATAEDENIANALGGVNFTTRVAPPSSLMTPTERLGYYSEPRTIEDVLSRPSQASELNPVDPATADRVIQSTAGKMQLPDAWGDFEEDPVIQGLRQALEDMKNKPTPGLTNPMGR